MGTVRLVSIGSWQPDDFVLSLTLNSDIKKRKNPGKYDIKYLGLNFFTKFPFVLISRTCDPFDLIVSLVSLSNDLIFKFID